MNIINNLQKYITLDKNDAEPNVGQPGNAANAIIIKQVDSTKAKMFMTDSNGYALEMSGGVQTFTQLYAGGNYVPGPLAFVTDKSDPTGNSSNNGLLGIDSSKATVYLGSYNKDTTGERNVQIGYKSLISNESGSDNTAVGNFVLEKNTTGELNTAIGSYSMRYITDAESNIAVGYATLAKAQNQSSNVYIGTFAGYYMHGNININDINETSPILLNYITGANKHLAPTFKYNEAAQTVHQSHNVAIGYASLSGSEVSKNNNRPNRALGSITIGNNTYDATPWRFYNNIVIGNFLTQYAWQNSIANSIIIGNHMQYHHALNILAIHNSKTSITGVTNALIYGEFDNRLLKINGQLQLNTTHNSNAQLTKLYNVYADSDGKLILEKPKLIEASHAVFKQFTTTNFTHGELYFTLKCKTQINIRRSILVTNVGEYEFMIGNTLDHYSSDLGMTFVEHQDIDFNQIISGYPSNDDLSRAYALKLTIETAGTTETVYVPFANFVAFR